MIQLKTIRRIHLGNVLRRLVLSWLIAVFLEYLRLPEALRNLEGLQGLARMSLPRILGITGGFSAFLSLLSVFLPTKLLERCLLPVAFGALSLAILRSSATVPFALACGGIGAAMLIYGIYGWDSSRERIPRPKPTHKGWLWIAAGLGAVFFLLLSAWTVGRVLTFSTPTYDFGIFSQMFYYLKTTGLPMTTLERDGLLSHFAVHVSPIYYLLLPLYCLFPTPATLQVLQAAVVISALIPLWKLGTVHGLTGFQRLLLLLCLLLYPAFSGGTSYDIHENCFLTPLILWLFYGIVRKKPLLIVLSALGTLWVKEDAAVYVAVIGLWLIVKTALRFKKKDLYGLLAGLGLLAGSLLWFFFVTDYLANQGDGVMTYRYSNFMYAGSSLLTVIKSVILNPMKAVYECVDREKLYFIALTLLPLLGSPLLTRRYERYILLIPYLLVNLMSDYRYQHDLFFQYTFGSNAFLIYLTLLNLADWKPSFRTPALIAAALVGVVCFSLVILPTAAQYPAQAVRYRGYYQSIRDTLDTVPEDASVAATTFYTTHLSQRETIYDIRYCTKAHLLECEYVVLSPSGGDYDKYATEGEANGFNNLIKLLTAQGYSLYGELTDVLVIYRRAGP